MMWILSNVQSNVPRAPSSFSNSSNYLIMWMYRKTRLASKQCFQIHNSWSLTTFRFLADLEAVSSTHVDVGNWRCIPHYSCYIVATCCIRTDTVRNWPSTVGQCISHILKKKKRIAPIRNNVCPWPCCAHCVCVSVCLCLQLPAVSLCVAAFMCLWASISTQMPAVLSWNQKESESGRFQNKSTAGIKGKPWDIRYLICM